MKELQTFIEEHLAKTKPLLKDLYMVHWEYDTTGNKELVEKKEELEKEYLEIYSDEKTYEKIKEFQKAEISDPLLKRQLKLLGNSFAMHQNDKKYIHDIVKLESDIATKYNHFRGKVDGEPLNDNQIKKILQNETNLELRKKAWEASKQIGAEVAEQVLELVRIRNKCAQEAGYSDYYNMSLTLNELDETKQFETLKRLEELSNEPFAKLKAQLDEEAATRFGIKKEQLRPWHCGDPFFQETPPHGKWKWTTSLVMLILKNSLKIPMKALKWRLMIF